MKYIDIVYNDKGDKYKVSAFVDYLGDEYFICTCQGNGDTIIVSPLP